MTTSIVSRSSSQSVLQVGGADVFAFDTTGVDSPLTLTASVSSNTMQLTLQPFGLRFRSATANNGTPTYAGNTTALNLVIPNTATMGTVNAVQSRLIVLAMYTGAGVELAVVNAAGGNDLSEVGLIVTTAIAAGSNSANVIYSTTARTAVPYRVVGFVDSTQATAGTWATAPTTVQSMGGQALTAMSSIGYGQTYQDVTASRAFATTYYNTTGKPIFVNVCAVTSIAGYGSAISFSINGVVYLSGGAFAVTSAFTSGFSNLHFIVPPGANYLITNVNTATLSKWSELR